MDIYQPDTSNYLSIALSDDLVIETPVASGSSTPQHPSDDAKAARAAAREKRIAAAVQRSKTEYKEEHAYTERGWLTAIDPVELNQTSPLDAHKFEQVLVSLCFAHPPQYATVVHAVLHAIDPKAKSIGSLTREILDMGLKAAIASGDREAALRLAKLSEPVWGHQMAGLAGNASDALALAGHDKEALMPLLVCTSAHGLHVPLLLRMTGLLSRIRTTLPSEAHQALRALEGQISQFVARHRSNFERPLFPDRHPPSKGTIERAVAVRTESEVLSDFEESVEIERLQNLLELDAEGVRALEGSLRRLEKGLRGSEPHADEPRGVREL